MQINGVSNSYTSSSNNTSQIQSLQSQLKSLQSDLKSVQSDTTLDEESKSTQVSLLESQISTIQSDINRGDVVVSGNLNTLIEATRSGDTDTINKLKAQSNSEQNNTYSSF